MSILLAILTGVLMGIVFGFALEKSRVFEPGMILGQMQLRNFTMLKIFLTAVTTGLLIIGTLYALDVIKLYPKPLSFRADIIGGLLLGAGIAIAGACPGTVAAQVGAGYRDALFTLAGGIMGAIAFVYAQPSLEPFIGGGPRLTLDVATGLPFAVLAFGMAAVLIGVLVFLERWRPWRDDLGSDVNGYFQTSDDERSAETIKARAPHPAE